MKKVFFAFVFLSFINTSSANIFGFGEKSWTKDDSRSLCNFMRSQNFMNDSAKILNDNSAIIKPPVSKKLIENYTSALYSAKLVEKSTLDKLHPAFFQNYEKYKQGIQVRINSFGESGTTHQALTAYKLISDFGSWYNTNKNSWQIPRGEVANCRKNL
jgi:hypothetical protein